MFQRIVVYVTLKPTTKLFMCIYVVPHKNNCAFRYGSNPFHFFCRCLSLFFSRNILIIDQTYIIIYIHVYIIFTYVLRICAYKYIHIVHTYTYIYIHTHIHMHINTHIYIYI